jgi:hypothetical protein
MPAEGNGKREGSGEPFQAMGVQKEGKEWNPVLITINDERKNFPLLTVAT